MPSSRQRPYSPPLIGVSGTARAASAAYPDDAAALADERIEAFFAAFAHQIAAAGGLPVFLSRQADPRELVRRLDGIVIAGGDDIDPRRYGATPDAATKATDPARDAFELALVDEAAAAGVPLLGTCRGHQVVNVARGGTLIPDLDSDPAPTDRHDVRDRPASIRGEAVRVRPGSLLHRLLGPETRVNSLHHQAIARPGEGVVATAHAPDGTIEAIEVEGLPVVGVQWHPEFHPAPDPLFGWLVQAAADARPERSSA